MNNKNNLAIIGPNKNETENNKNISKDHKDSKDNINNKGDEIGWCNYFYYLIAIKKNNPKIKYYKELREQIIGEESLFQN